VIAFFENQESGCHIFRRQLVPTEGAIFRLQLSLSISTGCCRFSAAATDPEQAGFCNFLTAAMLAQFGEVNPVRIHSIHYLVVATPAKNLDLGIR
jgi:hypothetical protein